MIYSVFYITNGEQGVHGVSGQVYETLSDDSSIYTDLESHLEKLELVFQKLSTFTAFTMEFTHAICGQEQQAHG